MTCQLILFRRVKPIEPFLLLHLFLILLIQEFLFYLLWSFPQRLRSSFFLDAAGRVLLPMLRNIYLPIHTCKVFRVNVELSSSEGKEGGKEAWLHWNFWT